MTMQLQNICSNYIKNSVYIIVAAFGLGACFVPHVADAAFLYFYPSYIEVVKNESFIVEVRLDTQGERINALEISGMYDEFLESIDAGKSNSILEIWISNPFASHGRFFFQGGIPGGYEGQGIIGTLVFNATEIGSAQVAFDEDKTRILLHSESVSPAELTFQSLNVNIASPDPNRIVLSSRSHPDESTWRQEHNFYLEWEVDSQTLYSYIISYDPLEKPDDVPEEAVGDIKFQDLNDGVYHFAVKKVGSNTVSRRRALIDLAPPEDFAIIYSQGTSDTNGRAFLSFNAVDKTAGIDYYEIEVGDQRFRQTSPTHILQEGFYGDAVVHAVDKAGNIQSATTFIKREFRFFHILIIVVILILLLLGSAITRKILRAKNQ